jgi:hypothetical protein
MAIKISLGKVQLSQSFDLFISEHLTLNAIMLALPGVEEGISYGTPAVRVRGKFLAGSASGCFSLAWRQSRKHGCSNTQLQLLQTGERLV